jgi:hypothetical protein
MLQLLLAPSTPARLAQALRPGDQVFVAFLGRRQVTAPGITGNAMINVDLFSTSTTQCPVAWLRFSASRPVNKRRLVPKYRTMPSLSHTKCPLEYATYLLESETSFTKTIYLSNL